MQVFKMVRLLLLAAVVLAGAAGLWMATSQPALADDPVQTIKFPKVGDTGEQGVVLNADGTVRTPFCGFRNGDEIPAQTELQRQGFTPCVAGQAGTYPCNEVDLMAFLPLNDIDADPAQTIRASSVWGWTDAASGREFALVGLRDKTSFVEITNPAAPVFVGYLPTHTGTSSWRELKVYNNYVFIVSDNNGNHGMQIFDLTQLLNVAAPPQQFTETALYDNAGSIHNIVINEDSGYAYAVGTSSGAEECGGGLHMINIQDPTNPTFAGCFANDGYTHDAQCVTYDGPDTDYTGRELCIASNVDTVTVVDVTNKAAPVIVDRVGYAGAGYIHQSWFVPGKEYMVQDDELDESNNGNNARTYIWDMRDLDNITVLGAYTSPSPSIDHNQYTVSNLVYQANYRAGMRVLDSSNIAAANLSEVGFFDIYPTNDNPQFNGAWNVFPYFPSGNVVVSGIEQGLYVLKFTGQAPTAVTTAAVSATSNVSGVVVLLAVAGVALVGAAGVVLRRRSA